MASGLVIGKFMPPHAGHQYLIDFARHFVEELTVQVCAVRAEPIPGLLRHAWVRDSFGGVRVVLNDDENPPEPADCPERFWEI
jgi:HTH-type transcriptional regulator, transcriptional repressor of NAD biosynthesis genes